MLLSERDGAVVTFTLNRPDKLNALSTELRAAVTRAFRAVGDDDVGVVVLTGAGRAFSAGVDLRELGGEAATGVDLSAADLDMVGAIRACPVPVIAAVNGVAVTGGFELALACDVIYASTAARFADTHARVGILPTWGMTERLPRLIGIARAKELSFSGRFIDAATAERWGLVNRVMEPDELGAAARTLADEIVGADPAAVRGMKRMYDEGHDRDFAAALDHVLAIAEAHNRSVTPEAIAARRADVQSRGRAQAGS